MLHEVEKAAALLQSMLLTPNSARLRVGVEVGSNSVLKFAFSPNARLNDVS